MDTTLKQRLIGAVVLIALAVIFLPMLIQGPAPGSDVADVSLRVPDAPAGEYETRELSLDAPAAAASPAALPAPATGQGVQTAAAPAADAAPATADPAQAAGNWAVSFGAYASSRDAEAVLSRLRQAGLRGFSEEGEINGRKAWRVRVGPYPDRALAEAGRLQAIRIRSDVNAQVIALDAAAEGTAPSASAPAPTAASGTPAASQAQAAATTAPIRSEALPPTPARTSTTASSTPPSTPPATTRPAPPATPPATTTPARPAVAATTSAAPAASSVGFAVQMGAFSRESDATGLRDRLRAAGFSAIVQPVRTDKGTLSRVRVGPVASRGEAEQLKARLATGGMGAGMVVSHP